jgi:hypothetical protein
VEVQTLSMQRQVSYAQLMALPLQALPPLQRMNLP